MTHEERKEARDYAWGYFVLHAELRLKLFNYCLILTGLIVSAYIALSDTANPGMITSILPLFLIAVAFIFWRLEERNRSLVKNSESALRFLDQQFSVEQLPDNSPHYIRLIERDDYLRQMSETKHSAVKRLLPVSYAECFRYTYLIIGLSGFGLTIWEWSI